MGKDTNRGQFVHNCIEEIGFGRFQVHALSMVCTKVVTFASMTSLVTIIQPYLRCQMNLTHFQSSWIITGESFARIFSSSCIGKISDLYGRQRTILFFFAMHLATSVLNALSSSLAMIVITRTAIGIFSPCRAPVMSYALETLPISKRKYLAALRMAVSLGSVYGLSVGVITLRYLSWRWFVVGAEVIPSVVCLVLASFLPESPRYLESMKRHEEAVAVLENIAIMNGKDPRLVKTLDEMTSDVVDQEKDQDTPMSGLEILQRISVMSLFMYTGALILFTISFGTMQFGENAEITSCGDCAHQLKYDYRIAMEVALCFSAIIAWILTAKFERITAIRSILILLSLCLIPLYWSIKGWALVSAVVLLSFFNSPLIVVTTVYEGELFPTCYRSVGMGVATSFYYFGMTCGGFLATYVYHKNRYISFGILHVVCLIAIILACFIPWKTRGEALKDR